MKFKNTNNAVINKLTIRTLKADKMRNLFVVLSVVLTTIMFTSLFTIGRGIIKSQEYTTMRQVGGSAHASFKYLDNEKLNKLKQHPLIKKYGYTIILANGENEEFSKINTEIRYADDEEAKMYFGFPDTGRMPESQDELATDTKILDLLNIPHKLGESITIKYKLGENEKIKKFKLCGFWNGDEVSPASMLWVSKDFIENELSNINLDDEEFKYSHAGTITLDVMYSNSINIEGKNMKVITDSGYSNNKEDENYIASGVNWSYMTTNFDNIVEIAIPILILSLLVLFTGYLIIYNIFQISVVKDIQFYGLLKTIGTTTRQIRKIITRQAVALCIVGMPIGLILGFLIGKIVLPYILITTNISNEEVDANPFIFMGAALFSLITVYMSCRRPGKIASTVSPVEAAKYCDVINPIKIKRRKKVKSSNIYNMSFYNLYRNKKKTFIVIISMSLSIILLNSIYTFTNSFSVDKYINKYLVADFVVANSNYFNVHKQFTSENDIVSESIITNIETSENFQDGGRIYYSLNNISAICSDEEKSVQLYGFDDFPINKLEILQGSIDLEKLKSGNYILEAVQPNDSGQYNYDKVNYSIGQKVYVDYGKDKKEYEVLAVVGINYSLTVKYFCVDKQGASFPNIILPSNEFCREIEDPLTMSYVYNVKQGKLNDEEKIINEYMNNIEKDMNYQSKETFIREFDNLKNMFNISGGILVFIIGIIGILNFVNAIITNIISRKREFAIIQSIGMTNKQLKRMLILEGVSYVFITICVSILLSILISFFALKKIIMQFWFCEYLFTIRPIIFVFPILILLSILVSLLGFKFINKSTIIERLRAIEQ